MSAAIHQLVIAIDERIAEARRQIAALEAARAQVSSDRARPHRTTAPARARTARQTPAPARETTTTARQDTGPARPRTARQPPASASPRRTAPAKRRRTVSAAELEGLLGDGGTLTTSAIAELAGAERDQVRGLLRDLEAAERVTRTGAGRGTRWRVITDEDRIAQRAAQLARQSRQAQAAQPEGSGARPRPEGSATRRRRA